MEDRDIIRLYFARAEDAIGKTAEKYGKRCLHLAKSIVSDERDAEECVNDAYFALWNRIPPEEPASLFAYLMKITRHIALDRFDYNTAACRNSEYALVLDELSEILPDESATVEEGETMKQINAFLAGEKERNRILFVRRYFYNDSLPALARRMHMSEVAVRQTLFRTRKKLMLYLKKEQGGNT